MASAVTGDITGYVVDQGGNFLSNVLVNIINNVTFETIGTTNTNSNGYYALENMAPFTNQYINYTKEGYESQIKGPYSLKLTTTNDTSLNIFKYAIVVMKSTTIDTKIEEWSRQRKLHTTAKRPTNVYWKYPFGLIAQGDYPSNPALEKDNRGVPYTQWGIIKSGQATLPYYEVLPTSKLNYQLNFSFISGLDWDYFLLLEEDVDWSYFRKVIIVIDIFIGSNYNIDTKKWNNLIAHHRWEFPIWAVRNTAGGASSVWYFSNNGSSISSENRIIPRIYGIFDALTGQPSYIFDKSNTLTTSIEYFSDKSNEQRSDLVSVTSSDESFDNLEIILGSTGHSTLKSSVLNWFNFVGNYKTKDVGLYARGIMYTDKGKDVFATTNVEFATYTSGFFGTVITIAKPSIHSIYNPTTGITTNIYVKEGNVIIDKIRCLFNDTILSSYSYEEKVYDRKILYTNNEISFPYLISEKDFKLFIIAQNELSKVIFIQEILWNDGTNNLGDIKNLAVDGSNPIGLVDPISNIMFSFYWKEYVIYCVYTKDNTNWSEPVIALPQGEDTSQIPQQSISAFFGSSNVCYISYQDSDNNVQTIPFNLSNLIGT